MKQMQNELKITLSIIRNKSGRLTHNKFTFWVKANFELLVVAEPFKFEQCGLCFCIRDNALNGAQI